jgi:hypothetical protein
MMWPQRATGGRSSSCASSHHGVIDDSLEAEFAPLPELAQQGLACHLELSGASDAAELGLATEVVARVDAVGTPTGHR